MEAPEINERARKANAVANLIRIIGVLFFLAMAFGVMTWKYAIFLGTACMVIAPAIRQWMMSKR